MSKPSTCVSCVGGVYVGALARLHLHVYLACMCIWHTVHALGVQCNWRACVLGVHVYLACMCTWRACMCTWRACMCTWHACVLGMHVYMACMCNWRAVVHTSCLLFARGGVSNDLLMHMTNVLGVVHYNAYTLMCMRITMRYNACTLMCTRASSWGPTATVVCCAEARDNAFS